MWLRLWTLFKPWAHYSIWHHKQILTRGSVSYLNHKESPYSFFIPKKNTSKFTQWVTPELPVLQFHLWTLRIPWFYFIITLSHLYARSIDFEFLVLLFYIRTLRIPLFYFIITPSHVYTLSYRSWVPGSRVSIIHPDKPLWPLILYCIITILYHYYNPKVFLAWIFDLAFIYVLLL